MGKWAANLHLKGVFSASGETLRNIFCCVSLIPIFKPSSSSSLSQTLCVSLLLLFSSHSFCSAFFICHLISLSSFCLCLYPNLSSSLLLPHSVTLGGFHNLKLSPKSLTSSFLWCSLSSSLSSSPSISLPFPLLIPSAHIFLDIHIYNLNFSYIFSPSPPLSPLSCFQYFMRE